MFAAVITGDSHAHFLELAAKRLGPKALGSVRAGWLAPARRLHDPFYEVTCDGVKITDPELAKNLEKTTGGRLLGGSVTANVGLSMGMDAFAIFHDKMWMTYKPAHCAGVGQIISQAAIERIFRNRSQPTVDFVAALKSAGTNVFIVTPPMRADSPYLSARDRLPLRLWVEAKYVSFFQRRLADMGVPILPRPPGTHDEQGCLKPAYKPPYEQDFFHGSIDYAAIVMEQILRHVRETTRPGSLRTNGADGAAGQDEPCAKAQRC